MKNWNRQKIYICRWTRLFNELSANESPGTLKQEYMILDLKRFDIGYGMIEKHYYVFVSKI